MNRRLSAVDTRLARDFEREPASVEPVEADRRTPTARLVVCAPCGEWWDECACAEVVTCAEVRLFDVVAELISNPRVRRTIGVRLRATDADAATAYARKRFGAQHPRYVLHAVEP